MKTEQLDEEYIKDEQGYDEEDDDEYYYDDEEDDMEYKEEVTVKDLRDQEDLTIQDMADFLSVFGDYSRIKIIESIIDIAYTVGEIAVFTGLTHSAVSHHLKVLRQAKLVAGIRDGRYVYYQVIDKHVREVYNLTRIHVEEFQKTISAGEENDELAEAFERELDKQLGPRIKTLEKNRKI